MSTRFKEQSFFLGNMRILTVSNCPLKEQQGSGYVIVNFARGLQACGHTVDLVGPEHFEPFSGFRRAKSYRQAIGMLEFVLRRLLRRSYDVVEFYGAEACLAAWALAHRRHRSFLMVQHSNGLETFVREKLGVTLRSHSPTGAPLAWYQSIQVLPIERAFTQVDAIATVSEVERLYAIEHGYQEPAQVAAIDNPLPDEFLDQAVSFDRDRTIGYCGSWLARKGTGIIESDIPRILSEFPDYRFKLIGVGAGFRKEKHFPSSVLPRVDVIGFVEDKRSLRELYRSLSILMVPSIHESFGLVMAEGMACGCAVVVGRTGFAHVLKDGEEALVIQADVPGGLYAAVKKLILDEALRQRIARAGYARVQTLRWPAAIKRLEGLYESWLASFRASRQP